MELLVLVFFLVFPFFGTLIAPFLFVHLFFSTRDSLREARERERLRPGSVPPGELRLRRLCHVLTLLAPCVLLAAWQGCIWLLGNVISFM